MKTKISIILPVFFSSIYISNAETILNNVTTIVDKSNSIATSIASLMMTLAFVAFLGIVVFFIIERRKGNPDGIQKAGSMLGWSVIALFVMVAIWGLVGFISGSFGIGLGGSIDRPNPTPVIKSSS